MAGSRMNGPVIYWSDDSPEALADAKAYIARFGLTRDDVSLVIKNRQTMIIAKRDCSAKLRD
jgi:hypothetical protein